MPPRAFSGLDACRHTAETRRCQRRDNTDWPIELGCTRGGAIAHASSCRARQRLARRDRDGFAGCGPPAFGVRIRRRAARCPICGGSRCAYRRQSRRRVGETMNSVRRHHASDRRERRLVEAREHAGVHDVSTLSRIICATCNPDRPALAQGTPPFPKRSVTIRSVVARWHVGRAAAWPQKEILWTEPPARSWRPLVIAGIT